MRFRQTAVLADGESGKHVEARQIKNANELAVAAVLTEYQEALSESDTDAVTKLYAPDGVFMPQHFRCSVGTDAVRKAYRAVFEAVALTMELKVAEVLQVAPDWAIARTNSTETVKVLETGESRPEAVQELFEFQKIDGAWRIALLLRDHPISGRYSGAVVAEGQACA